MRIKKKLLIIFLSLFIITLPGLAFVSAASKSAVGKKPLYINPPAKEINAVMDKCAKSHGIKADYLKALAYGESSWRHIDEKTGRVLQPKNLDGTTDWGIMKINDYWHKKAFQDKINVTSSWKKNIDYGAGVLCQCLMPVFNKGKR